MQPRHNPLSLKDVLLWSLLFPSIAGALQQPSNGGSYPSRRSADELSDAAAAAYEQRWRSAVPDSLNTPPNGRYRDTHVEEQQRQSSKSRRRTSSPDNERALATISPAESNPAVREAPPAKSPVSTGGISSRQEARSLQDWQVEDIILLATVDGKIWARDRTTGAHKWVLEVDRPMVETVYHRHNKSVDEHGVELEDPMWIVEPSQDGAIYVYTPRSGFGMRRLGLTVKGLSELSPYASDEYPEVVYNAEKSTSLYTVDAGTGHIVRSFTSSGSFSNADRTCKRVSIEDSLEEEECEAVGTLTLGRTEYTIAVVDRNTGEQISTIKYFEWGPNNRDQDLRSKYFNTMDNKYVYTKHDGAIFGLDLGGGLKGQRSIQSAKPTYWEKFPSPVARVYDVVRPSNDMSSDASLVVLQQPTGPSPDVLGDLEDEESIFVNCTESGSWYALSKSNYPGVTDGAATAQCYSDELFTLPSLPLLKHHRAKFTGLHLLQESPQLRQPGTPLIGAEDHLGIDPPPENESLELIHQVGRRGWSDRVPSLQTLLVAIVIALVGAGVVYRDKFGQYTSGRNAMTVPMVLPPLDELTKAADAPMLREDEPAQETIFPHDGAEQRLVDAAGGATNEQLVLSPSESNEGAAADDAADDEKDEQTNKPKGHKRGKRGGKKHKEKEAQNELRKRKPSQVPEPAEVITVAASESPQVAGPLQINSLVIHTDKVIGQGSCGTSVFEGSFEGREVAVKRMLSQYYELAYQEVSFLQQSDDHPNVVRYFCQQKDDHFLYIAVELCQASLFEVWEAEKAKTEARQQQLQTLKLSIQQDVPRTLQQLAAGLYHLHNLRIIHRDIKPQNILVAYPKRGQPGIGPRLVISDFGLGKNLPENVSTLIDPTGNAGTSGWKAPELISQPKDTDSKHSQSGTTDNSASGTAPSSGVKRAADIFSLGCLFFWVLTDGIHPYEDENGWQQLRELNIKRDNKKMETLARWSDAYEPMQLITSMLAHKPEDRPTALQVLNHPFFWSSDKRLAFLCDCSDHFEREPRGTVSLIPPCSFLCTIANLRADKLTCVQIDDGYFGDSSSLRLLESRAEEVIGAPYERADFLSKLDRHFVDTLGKQRKYSGNRFLDLLRALRNKKNHYEDMPEDVKRRVGPLAGGYLSYWCNRFPRLLMACHDVVHEVGIERTDRFKGYFI